MVRHVQPVQRERISPVQAMARAVMLVQGAMVRRGQRLRVQVHVARVRTVQVVRRLVQTAQGERTVAPQG